MLLVWILRADNAPLFLSRALGFERKDKLSFDMKQIVSLNTCCVNEAPVLRLDSSSLSFPSPGPEWLARGGPNTLSD